MNIERYKTLEAVIIIAKEDEPVKEWGLNIKMDEDTVTFEQGFRDIVYHKSLIKQMDLKVKKNWTDA